MVSLAALRTCASRLIQAIDCTWPVSSALFVYFITDEWPRQHAFCLVKCTSRLAVCATLGGSVQILTLPLRVWYLECSLELFARFDWMGNDINLWCFVIFTANASSSTSDGCWLGNNYFVFVHRQLFYTLLFYMIFVCLWKFLIFRNPHSGILSVERLKHLVSTITTSVNVTKDE